jgi:hypothetical protein
MNNSAAPAKGSWSDHELETLRVLVEKAEADPTQTKISKEMKWANIAKQMQKHGMKSSRLTFREASSLHDKRKYPSV